MQWLLEDWISTLPKGGGAKKKQFCVNPNSSNQFLYFRAIQGHSGDNAVDLALQDNVLLPKEFTEYIYHVGKPNELNSIIRNGLIPGGKKPQERKTSSILHYSELEGRRIGHGGNSTRSYETKDRAVQEFLDTLSKYSIVVQFKARPRGSAILPNAVTVVLHNTLRAAFIEKAVCMKTHGELHQKVRLTPRVPRVVPKSNSQCGQQDPQNQDARSSWEPSSDSKSYEETCNNTVDSRISGVPHSAVEQQDTIRENNGEDQQVQQKIARLDRRHDQHRDLRTLRKLFQTAMS